MGRLMVRSWDDCVDLGHGRGRAERSTAEAIWRIDRDLGRPADVNEAWRSPEQANANRARWLAYERYLNGGPYAPKAPYALGAEHSVHCDGTAVDSDDWYNAAAAAAWRRHGFRQTARYPGTARDEPWHGEHRNEWEEVTGAPAGSATNEENELMGAREDIVRDVRAMIDATNDNLEKQTQKQQDVTRAFLAELGQKMHDVTRAFLGELSQKQHDVTRGYVVDTVVGALSKFTPTIDEAAVKAAVEAAVADVTIEPIDVGAIAAAIKPVDVEAIAKRVNDEADQRERDRLGAAPTAV